MISQATTNTTDLVHPRGASRFIPDRFESFERLKAFEEFSYGNRTGWQGGPRMTSLSAMNANYNKAERLLNGPVRYTRVVTSGYAVREGDRPGSAPPQNLYVSLYEAGNSYAWTRKGEECISTGDVCINFSRHFQLCYSEGEQQRLIMPRHLLGECHSKSDQLLVIRKSDPVANVIWSVAEGLADAGRRQLQPQIQTMSDLMVSVTQTVLDADRRKSANSGYDHVRDKAMEYIRDNLHRSDLSVTEVIHYVGVSRATLYRAFENVGGLKEFIVSERVARAKEMLQIGRTDRGQIAAAAYNAGFASPEQFSKTFKARTGMSPTQFVMTRLH